MLKLLVLFFFIVLLEVNAYCRYPLGLLPTLPIPTAIIHKKLQYTNFYSRIYRHDLYEDQLAVNEPISLSAQQKENRLLSIIQAATIVLLNFPVVVAAREKGAFEMDAEFYMKDLLDAIGLKGSQTSGTQNGFQKKPIYKSPRTLDRKFASNIVNIIASSVAQLSKTTQVADLIAAVIKRTDSALLSFKTFAPITAVDITDQYYFDMLLYLYYIEAGNLLPTSEERVLLRKFIGERILSLLEQQYSIQSPSSNIRRSLESAGSNKREVNLLYAKNIGLLAAGLVSILGVFKSTGLIADFKFDVDDLVDEEYAFSSFEDNLAVSFQVTILEPATLLGFLLQAAANTFFHPEIIATTMCAYARSIGYKIRFEDYLMDRYYRPENDDVQAQDILLEFTLSAPTSSTQDF